MYTLVLVCGVYSLAFAGFHLLFWKLFNWKTELKKLSFANRGILQILNLRIIYIFFLIAFLCFAYPDELLNTRLGKAVMIGMSLFWLGRLIEQLVLLRAKHVVIHILTAVFAMGAILFASPLIVACCL
ncbi:hypothetical protein [Pedobacter sp. SYP-B3415]|uniref:hypothetical protein n=1 Tax=Pedobacter sp. SYP-B3415 TaxID=2496641 RepID=UPI00101C53C8|nr:hypothetical protein [Pedobacter sp. SYP-B3415]